MALPRLRPPALPHSARVPDARPRHRVGLPPPPPPRGQAVRPQAAKGRRGELAHRKIYSLSLSPLAGWLFFFCFVALVAGENLVQAERHGAREGRGCWVYGSSVSAAALYLY